MWVLGVAGRGWRPRCLWKAFLKRFIVCGCVGVGVSHVRDVHVSCVHVCSCVCVCVCACVCVYGWNICGGTGRCGRNASLLQQTHPSTNTPPHPHRPPTYPHRIRWDSMRRRWQIWAYAITQTSSMSQTSTSEALILKRPLNSDLYVVNILGR